jgi:Anti-sigma-28 factor, FlgM.
MVRRPNKSILAHTMTLRTRYEDHIEFFGREAEESNSDRAGRRRTMEAQRAMYIQELKERVASGEYAVDPDIVAAAIVRRWRVVQQGAVVATRRVERRQLSREVVKAG